MKRPLLVLPPAALWLLAVTLLFSAAFCGRVQGFEAPPPSPGVTVAALSGRVKDLAIKADAERSLFHVSALLSLQNNTDLTLKNLTAVVYVSADARFHADDLKMAKLKLDSYLPDGKVSKLATVSVPIKRKLTSSVASYLDGKYLVILVTRDGATLSEPIVVGPISLP